MRIFYISSIALALSASPPVALADTGADDTGAVDESTTVDTVTLRVEGMMKSRSGAT